MCERYWPNNILDVISKSNRLVILGIGHELRGDDAVGLYLVRDLSMRIKPMPFIKIIAGGPAPENILGTIRRFNPDRVVMIDTAQMGTEPGEVRWLDWRNLNGALPSTHTQPLTLLVKYLFNELGCQITLLGIEPAQTQFGKPLSPVVEKAREALLSMFDIAIQIRCERKFVGGFSTTPGTTISVPHRAIPAR